MDYTNASPAGSGSGDADNAEEDNSQEVQELVSNRDDVLVLGNGYHSGGRLPGHLHFIGHTT